MNYQEFILNEQKKLNEGWWSDLKYQLSKLGSLTKGGKIIGRNKINKQAETQIELMLNDYANTMIKEVHNDIQKMYPEFPNNKNREDFLNGLSLIAILYDSIYESINSGNMDTDKGNLTINNIRIYVKWLIDYKLSSVYTVFESEFTNEEEPLNEIIGWLKKKFGMSDNNTNTKPISGTDFTTQTGKSLDSKKTEKFIAALGVSFGVLGWVTQTEWFKELIDQIFRQPAKWNILRLNEYYTSKIVAAPGQGLTQVMNASFHSNITPDTTVFEFNDELARKMGGGSLEKGVKNIAPLMKDPSKAKELYQLLKTTEDTNHNMTLGELFKSKTPTSGSGSSLFQVNLNNAAFGTTVYNSMKVMLLRGAVKGSVVFAAKTAGLTSILLPLGITLTAGALTSMVIKWKAKKSSRFKDLKDLLEKLLFISNNNQVSIPLDAYNQPTNNLLPNYNNVVKDLNNSSVKPNKDIGISGTTMKDFSKKDGLTSPIPPTNIPNYKYTYKEKGGENTNIEKKNLTYNQKRNVPNQNTPKELAPKQDTPIETNKETSNIKNIDVKESSNKFYFKSPPIGSYLIPFNSLHSKPENEDLYYMEIDANDENIAKFYVYEDSAQIANAMIPPYNLLKTFCRISGEVENTSSIINERFGLLNKVNKGWEFNVACIVKFI